MKTNCFIIHGTFGDPKDHWFSWFKLVLEKKGHVCIAPEFTTEPGVNNYETRKKILTEYVANGVINENTIFIGHSSGSVVSAKFLIEEKVKAKGIISISGFNNADGPLEDYNKINSDFFIADKELEKITAFTKFVYCFYSENDPYSKKEDLEHFAKITQAKKIFVEGAGHFNTDTGYTTFPELLKIINTDINKEL